MCVKSPLEDLNPGHYPSHPVNTYICGVTTAPRVRGGYLFINNRIEKPYSLN